MKECAKPPPPPKPNLKNKDFVKWSRGESFKREDNIMSSEWREKLQRTPPFIPVYDNAPLNMVYLLSGEYGRIWQKERDEWYSKVFVLSRKDQDLDDRKKKLRKEFKEAKKRAQLKIQERKEKKAKEAELKAKLEAERAEKLKAKLQKNSGKKKVQKKSIEQPETTSSPPPPPPTPQTTKCECSDHDKEASCNKEAKKEEEFESVQNKTDVEDSQHICKNYLEQLHEIQKKAEKPVCPENDTQPVCPSACI